MAVALRFATLLLLLLPSPLWCQSSEVVDGVTPSDVFTVGALIPFTHFDTLIRAFNVTFLAEMNYFKTSQWPVFNFTRRYNDIRLWMVMLPPDPSPNEILKALCFEFLSEKVSAIVHVSSTVPQNQQFSSAEYFLQMTNYLGIPVISTWSAANAGVERKVSDTVVLQLAPTLGHEAAAIVSVLVRYDWQQFSVVTSQMLGHESFILSIQYEIDHSPIASKLKYALAVTLNDTEDTKAMVSQLRPLADGDVRVILLHCNADEAIRIMAAAQQLNMTRKDFMWIVTKSVVVHQKEVSRALPVGMLGIDYDVSSKGQFNMFRKAIRILGHGLEAFVNDPNSVNRSLSSTHVCLGQSDEKWKDGLHLHRHLLGVKFKRPASNNEDDQLDQIQFQPDGTLKYASMDVVNLDADHRWTKVGTWQMGALHIKDIVWPGQSTHPPYGRPENYHLQVAFMEEPPYVHMTLPDNRTGLCHYQAVECRIPPVPPGHVDPTGVGTNETHFRCCSGFCVDLLRRLARDMAFTFEMQRAPDGLWGGVQQNNTWNGIMAELIEGRVDIAMTSLKINSHRQKVVDFSVPYLETGISVVVAKRTGIISATAFLEPFDTISWFFIFIICIQAAALAIFIFEWLSPSGYDQKMAPTSGHRFSLFRTYWLVWALLLGASVNIVAPRGYTARFMSNVWAGFTVVFLAIYTANLAAFMITREEFYNLSGVEDRRLTVPFSHNPVLRFGTIPNGNTDDILRTNFPEMHRYMRNHSRVTVQEGIAAVKKRELDAFIYDSTVLEYLVGQDDECRILTVGKWYAKTGYAVAFPKNSKHLKNFDHALLYYSSLGDLARMSDYWLGGACKLNKGDESHLEDFSFVPLGLKQFTSAFILLFCGLVLGVALLGLETLYFEYLRAPLARSQRKNNCCTLISLNLGHSLSFGEVVAEARDIYKYHKCKDPICDTLLWKVRHQLDFAKLEIVKMDQQINQLKSALQNATEQPSCS